LQQEIVGHFEERAAADYPFERDTDASNNLRDFRGGFTTSPWRPISFTAHYRRFEKDTEYDHLEDVLFGGPGLGYPAFIRRRKITSDEVEPRLVWHATPWLKTTLSYKLVATDFDTAVDPLIVGPTVYTPGDRIQAGNYDSHVYSVNFSLTPWRRIYLSTTFSYQDSRSSVPIDVRSVVPYKGRVYSALASGNVALSEKNDLHLAYSFSHADYDQHNEEAGLPLGITYRMHGAQVGLTRRLLKNIAANLRYGFFAYDEPSAGGFNDYTAHVIFGTVVVRFP
jgi:hypothetical protein